MPLLCTMIILNIVMLLVNIYIRIDTEKTLAEIKERLGGSEMKK